MIKTKRIVTLSSDYGVKDYYIALVKGALYSTIDSVNIVDISHEIRRLDIVDASETIGNAIFSFPKDTIHLVSCDDKESITPHIVATYNHQIIVTPDTGFLSLMVDDISKIEAYQIPPKFFKQTSFYVKDIYVPIVKALMEGHPIDKMGEPYNTFNELHLPKPFVSNRGIRGVIKSKDSYGNLITNISKTFFDTHARGKRFRISTTYDMYSTESISTTYDEVNASDLVVLFNTQDCLEIAIKNGSAADLLNMSINSPIEIEWI